MDEDKVIDELILNGGIEVAGIDQETGQLLYAFTPKIKDLRPDLYNQHINHVNGEIMRLWENGFVNVDLLEDEPTVTLTKKAFDNTAISSLSKNDQWALEEMKRLMKRPEL